MKKQFGAYRRLARGRYSCSSLWLGPDHLVYVQGTGFLIPFVEEYRRFAYRDVLAISTAPTRAATWWGILGGSGAALAGLLIWLAIDRGGAGWVAAIFLAPVLIVCLTTLILNLALGPSCQCRLQTAVGSVRVRTLSRTRAADRAIADLRPLILEHQGGATIAAEDQDQGRLTGAPGREEAVSLERPRGPQVLRRPAFLTTALYLMIFSGTMWVVYSFAEHWWPLPVLGIAYFPGLLAIVAALIHGMRTFTPGGILAVLWIGATQKLVQGGVMFAAYFWWSLKNSMIERGASDVPEAVFVTNIEAPGFPFYYGIITGLILLLLGFSGLGLAGRYRLGRISGAKPPALTPSIPPAKSEAVGDSESGSSLSENDE